jgi:hypothetical protein
MSLRLARHAFVSGGAASRDAAQRAGVGGHRAHAKGKLKSTCQGQAKGAARGARAVEGQLLTRLPSCHDGLARGHWRPRPTLGAMAFGSSECSRGHGRLPLHFRVAPTPGPTPRAEPGPGAAAALRHGNGPARWRRRLRAASGLTRPGIGPGRAARERERVWSSRTRERESMVEPREPSDPVEHESHGDRAPSTGPHRPGPIDRAPSTGPHRPGPIDRAPSTGPHRPGPKEPARETRLANHVPVRVTVYAGSGPAPSPADSEPARDSSARPAATAGRVI